MKSNHYLSVENYKRNIIRYIFVSKYIQYNMTQALAYISETFYFFYIIILIGTILIVISENRNPLKTMSWLMILFFLPVLGLIIYFLFGQKWYKKHRIDKRNYNKLAKEQLSNYLRHSQTAIPEEYTYLTNLFKNTEKSIAYPYNNTETFYNGYDYIISLLKDISKAKHHIHLEYYIFLSDATGNLIKDALIEKAKEGVKVRIIIDDLGSWQTKKSFIEEMKQNDIEISKFFPVKLQLISSKINYRNHRKLAIIDGNIGYMGGMNIADRYIKGTNWGCWRDTQVRITGFAVHDIQTIFLLDWYFTTKRLISDEKYFPECETKGNATILIGTSAPFNNWRRIMQGIAMSIIRAKKYFYMQTPYFMPTEPIITAMQMAALSGVDVRIILPEKSDSKMTHMATKSYLKSILQAGVKVYFYKPGFIHSKMMVSDDMLSIIGSTNIDFRSFEQNFEVNAFIIDKKTALDAKEQFLIDQKQSKRITIHAWDKRPRREKFAESVIRIFSPLL